MEIDGGMSSTSHFDPYRSEAAESGAIDVIVKPEAKDRSTWPTIQPRQNRIDAESGFVFRHDRRFDRNTGRVAATDVIKIPD
ncbi:hypothetical protein [Bradyrhizobium sp.]|uniref:hypothetical protein n=1 Tax=Bradyrhizobium sp. TaxID=376 RepID=UPI0026395767|nr:hypothetical protein [Bradyrhizobium sp.]